MRRKPATPPQKQALRPAPKNTKPRAPETPHLPDALDKEISDTEHSLENTRDPREIQALTLRKRLLGILREGTLRKSRVGVTVVQASNGRVLFSHHGDQLFNPASNTKMLTTAAALALLGGDFRYSTSAYGHLPDESGIVEGNLVLRGSGDPSLTTTDLAELARQLAGRGVVHVAGDVVADPSFRGTPAGGGATPEQNALILDRNTYGLRLHPTVVGKTVAVSLDPRDDFFVVDNHAITVKGKRARLQISVVRSEGRVVLSIRGRLGISAGDRVIRRRLPDGAFFVAALFRSLLGDFGITVEGRARVSTGAADDPPKIFLLAEHRSARLSDVCRLSNKPSNNFVAETIYKTLGGELFGWPGSLAKGTRAVMDYLSSMGIAATRYRIVNGSGLTHENRISPAALAELLRRIYFDLSVAPDFMSSLAVSGIDGTIRDRFAGTDAVGLVRAKTGTLSGVSALSGYVGEKEDVLIFTILVEGFRDRRVKEIRHAQVQMVQAMLRYLRADASTNAPDSDRLPALPSGSDSEDQSEDSEADGDPAYPPAPL